MSNSNYFKNFKIMNVFKYAFVFLLLLSSTQSFSSPAIQDKQELFQKNGTTIQAIQKGDEWINWIETKDGYTINKANDGNWYYVTSFKEKNGSLQILTDGKVLANLPPPSHLKKHITPPLLRPTQAPDIGTNTTVLGAPNGNFSGSILFILAEFSDKTGTTTEASWGNFVSNNIADYFNKVSYNKVNLQAASDSYGITNNGVVGWLNMGYNHPNTGGNTGSANRTLTRDAIIAADPYVDYASYDANNDGYVDSDELAIVIIAAGYERSYSSNYSPNVWGHKWSVFPNAPNVDGVTVASYHSGAGGYAQFGENHQRTSTDGHQATMGIMVHELGHLIFAFPDLYDYDQSSSGIGAFGVMGGGSWGAKTSNTYAGESPVFPTAWSQVLRGWATASEGVGTESITASGSNSATSSSVVRKASTSVSSQYFLVQNRQNQGYDGGFERWLGSGFNGGLLVLHINDLNSDNTNDTDRWVDVEEADGVQMGTSRGNDNKLWRSGHADTFSNSTNPNSKLNNGTATGIEISSISTTGTVMTATFSNSNSLPVISSPTTGSVLAGSTQIFTLNNNGITFDYWYLRVGSTLGANDIANRFTAGANNSITINGLPTDNSAVYVHLQYKENGIWKIAGDYTYTASSPLTLPLLTSPVTGSTLSGSAETFTLNNNGITLTNWNLRVGSSVGGYDIANRFASGSANSIAVSNIPTDSSTIYVRLQYKENGIWKVAGDYTYTASSPLSLPLITNPVTGSTLSGSTQIFALDDNGITLTNWNLRVGSSIGGIDIANRFASGSAASISVSNLPTNSSTIYVRLQYKENGTWKVAGDYTYTASN